LNVLLLEAKKLSKNDVSEPVKQKELPKELPKLA
jgi:hypothetical protein